jgi:phospholipid-binding lipoprotein MlaA
MLTKRGVRLTGSAGRLLLLGLLVLLLSACASRTARPQAEDAPAAPEAAQTENRNAAEPEAAQAENHNAVAPGAYPDRLSPLEEDELDDYLSAPAQAISDPLEGWNRFWFGFNDVLYVWVLQPLHKAYVFVTPQELRTGLKNALTNALFPVRFVNSLLQGKFLAAGVEFSRFILNSTLGVGGLINMAKDHKTIVPVDPEGADFGQTLGVWGAESGFYLVLPLIGPSTARDAVGRAGDWLIDPLLFVPGTTTTNVVTLAIWGGLRFNAADDTLNTYENIKKAAVDPYIAMRDMYAKYRQNRIARARAPQPPPQSLAPDSPAR